MLQARAAARGDTVRRLGVLTFTLIFFLCARTCTQAHPSLRSRQPRLSPSSIVSNNWDNSNFHTSNLESLRCLAGTTETRRQVPALRSLQSKFSWGWWKKLRGRGGRAQVQRKSRAAFTCRHLRAQSRLCSQLLKCSPGSAISADLGQDLSSFTGHWTPGWQEAVGVHGGNRAEPIIRSSLAIGKELNTEPEGDKVREVERQNGMCCQKKKYQQGAASLPPPSPTSARADPSGQVRIREYVKVDFRSTLRKSHFHTCH